MAHDMYENLFYEPDLENEGEGEVLLGDGFEWDRKKSNDNIKDHGYSFYLARLIYDDTYVCFVGRGSSLSGSGVYAGIIPGDTGLRFVVEADQPISGGRIRITSSRKLNPDNLKDAQYEREYITKKKSRQLREEAKGIYKKGYFIAGIKTQEEEEQNRKRIIKEYWYLWKND